MTHIPSIAERRAALNDIFLAHSSTSAAISTILDYLDDPAAISSPSMIEALDIVNGADPDFADITQTVELISEFDSETAKTLAARAELCMIHFCDPENCADEH